MIRREEIEFPNTRGWQQLDFPRGFSILAPPGATHGLFDDDRSMAIRLPTRPATEVLFGSYAIGEPDANVGWEILLRDTAEKCIANGIRPQMGTDFPPDIQVDRAGDWNVCRTVLLVKPRWLWRPARYWYFWMWALDDSPRLWLLHWNGPERDLHKFVIPMFCTFQPQL